MSKVWVPAAFYVPSRERVRVGRNGGARIAALALAGLAIAAAASWYRLGQAEAPLAARTRRRLVRRDTAARAGEAHAHSSS